ncbi:Dabb family protein [Aliiruegeria sabulilitoris]|uniref:Dabb family protein n=1 Tax=Aliiruegeria sabulilitoris TaxID=1510458 RepID=UPI00082EE97E|nr:Dabb family protein [Aliiruegeria sabulilitoris]NDR55907.1 Dabb family protein [Pseudoruegeria sp. M32A2M]
MIRHCVMLGLRDGFDAEELEAVLDGLEGLVQRMPGSHRFAAGPNRDFENKTAGFPHGFTIDFDSRAALSAYAEHPEHRTLGARLVALCGGAERIAVFDLEIR